LEEEREVKEELEVEAEEVAVVEKAEDIFSPLEEEAAESEEMDAEADGNSPSATGDEDDGILISLSPM